METKEMMDRLEEHFGSRAGMLGFQLVNLSTFGQPCDVTFFERKPILNVKVDQQLGLALMYGAGARKFSELLQKIKFSNSTVASIDEIWTVNPMPTNGFTAEELSGADMAEAEEKAGPNGETLRQMISETYHCGTVEEEDKYLRRFIAS